MPQLFTLFFRLSFCFYVIAYTTLLAEGNDFLCTFIVKMLILLIFSDRLAVVCPTKNNLINKADCLKNLSKALIYLIRCRIRLNAYPCLTARFVKGF